MKDLNDIQRKIEAAIQAHADKHGMTYEEAADAAYVTVNGVQIEPIAEYSFRGEPAKLRPQREREE